MPVEAEGASQPGESQPISDPSRVASVVVPLSRLAFPSLPVYDLSEASHQDNSNDKDESDVLLLTEFFTWRDVFVDDHGCPRLNIPRILTPFTSPYTKSSFKPLRDEVIKVIINKALVQGVSIEHPSDLRSAAGSPSLSPPPDVDDETPCGSMPAGARPPNATGPPGVIATRCLVYPSVEADIPPSGILRAGPTKHKIGYAEAVWDIWSACVDSLSNHGVASHPVSRRGDKGSLRRKVINNVHGLPAYKTGEDVLHAVLQCDHDLLQVFKDDTLSAAESPGVARADAWEIGSEGLVWEAWTRRDGSVSGAGCDEDNGRAMYGAEMVTATPVNGSPFLASSLAMRKSIQSACSDVPEAVDAFMGVAEDLLSTYPRRTAKAGQATAIAIDIEYDDLKAQVGKIKQLYPSRVGDPLNWMADNHWVFHDMGTAFSLTSGMQPSGWRCLPFAFSHVSMSFGPAPIVHYVVNREHCSELQEMIDQCRVSSHSSRRSDATSVEDDPGYDTCTQTLQHGDHIIPPHALKKNGIPFRRIVQFPHETFFTHCGDAFMSVPLGLVATQTACAISPPWEDFISEELKPPIIKPDGGAAAMSPHVPCRHTETHTGDWIRLARGLNAILGTQLDMTFMKPGAMEERLDAD